MGLAGFSTPMFWMQPVPIQFPQFGLYLRKVHRAILLHLWSIFSRRPLEVNI